ncbi:MAG: cyclase family protein [Clostridia bacterium]|nr:cyclase family protein [Clostridia bacterium]
MLIDITMKVTPDMLKDAPGNENKALIGHIGTHFDVMEQEFPLEYTGREGIVFDVSAVKNRDIGISDIDMDKVSPGMFVGFCTGFIEEIGYGGKAYFGEHPQLSHELIDALIEKGISLIGLDFAGIRRGKEHIPKDRFCAERGVFVIENLCNLKTVAAAGGRFFAHTYPVNYTGMTGLPCRVVAEVMEA